MGKGGMMTSSGGLTSGSSVANTTTRGEENGDKLIYCLGSNYTEGKSNWFVIDPHYSNRLVCNKDEEQEEVNHHHHHHIFKLDPVTGIRYADHIEDHLGRLHFYGPAAAIVNKSKVHIFGGFSFNDGLDYCNHFSKKVFIFDLLSKTWEEGPSEMKIARGAPTVVSIGDIIYIFGCNGDHLINGEEWVERYNVLTGTSEFIEEPTPDEVVVNWRYITLSTHYEHRKQILLWMSYGRVYSFDYLTEKFSPFYPSINEVATLSCSHVVVVEDVLFWHYFGKVYAYDLFNNHMLFHVPLGGNIKMIYGEAKYLGEPDFSYLVQVGKDTLFLICWDVTCGLKTVHCYRFQIQKSSSEETSAKGIGGGSGYYLLQDGFEVLDAPSNLYVDLLLVVV